jgi:hypothetical protein
MKILSYKLLSEAEKVFNVGGFDSKRGIGTGLVGGDLSARKYGINDESTNFFFEKTVKMNFKVFHFSGGGGSQISAITYAGLFLQRLSNDGKTLILHPYDKFETEGLTEKDAIRWGNLRLFDRTNTAVDLSSLDELMYNEKKPETWYYKFSFNIPDIDYFKQANSKYKFTNLDTLENFDTPIGQINPDYYMLFLSIVEGNIEQFYGRSKAGSAASNKYRVGIKIFDTNGTSVSLPFFPSGLEEYFLNFSATPPVASPDPAFQYVTSFENNNRIAYIYTQTQLTNRSTFNTPVDCYILIPGNNTPVQHQFQIVQINKI